MNTVTNATVLDAGWDGLTVSMVEVDAAAARAALADRLRLAQVDLEHPAVAAVLAAVVAAGWRPPPIPRGDHPVASGSTGHLVRTWKCARPNQQHECPDAEAQDHGETVIFGDGHRQAPDDQRCDRREDG